MNPTTQTIIFTDLDGTLIDFETYDCSVTKPWVQRLRAAGIPVVFCSSKTFAEQRDLQKQLNFESPCIVENGAAIIAPGDFWDEHPEGSIIGEDGWVRIELGMRSWEIRSKVMKIESLIGESLIGFSRMPTEDLARRTGLDLLSAKRAAQREYSETLAVAKPDSFWRELKPLFEEQGLACFAGGRFHTVVDIGVDKGKAIDYVSGYWKRLTDASLLTIGLGDSDNDRPLFQAVDCPRQVQRPDGTWEDLGLPRSSLVEGVGPNGWVKAISPLLQKPEEPGSILRKASATLSGTKRLISP